MNTNTRNVTIEVLLNGAEVSCLDRLRGGLGRSPYFRHLINVAERTDGKAPPQRKESRGCRGPGRPAARGSAFMSLRRQV
jgi:hypothetical protein